MKTEYDILEEEKRFKTICSLLETIGKKENDEEEDDDDSAIVTELKGQGELLNQLIVELREMGKVKAPEVNVAAPDNKSVTTAVEKLSALLVKSNEELQRLYFKKEMISSFDVKYDAAGDIKNVIVNYQNIK